MRRRTFLLSLAGAAMSPAGLLHAQQKAIPVIGYLNFASPGPRAAVTAAFLQGLSETGYVEGQNLAIEYRWAEGHYDRLPALAADLVGLLDRQVGGLGARENSPDIGPSLASKRGAERRGEITTEQDAAGLGGPLLLKPT